MAGLIETSQMQSYFKLFIYSLHSEKLKSEWQKQMLCNLKKKKIFFFLFALLPSSLKPTFSIFPSCKNIFHFFDKLFDQK